LCSAFHAGNVPLRALAMQQSIRRMIFGQAF
jgi:hypothetical protein